MLIFQKSKIVELLKSGLGSVREHDYIYRKPIAEKHSGKSVRRYEYIYEEDRVKRPIQMLKKFFGIVESKLEEMYSSKNIKKDFNADKKTFAEHLVEYLSRRKYWDSKFAPKENQKKFNKPVKMAVVKENPNLIPENMKTPAAESEQMSLFEEKKESEWKANPYLMRRIWGMFTGKNIEQQEKQAKTAEEVIDVNLVNKINSENVDIAVKTGIISAPKKETETESEKPLMPKQRLEQELKPALMNIGIIPHSQIEATNLEQVENVKSLLETIGTMPKLYEGTHLARLHYFVGDRDYYITELGDNGEAYGYVDVNGDPEMSEWGYIDLKELCAADTNPLNPVNIDYFFKPEFVGDLIKKNGHKKLAEHYDDMFAEEEEEQKKKLQKDSKENKPVV